MNIHTPYRDRLNRDPDFIVEYEIDLCEEMKGSKPNQGMRVDFLYEEDVDKSEVYMIWPELLDSSGNIITDLNPDIIEAKGKANMWVVNEKIRPYHAERISVGTKGYWVRGSFRLARVTVIAIGSLKC